MRDDRINLNKETTEKPRPGLKYSLEDFNKFGYFNRFEEDRVQKHMMDSWSTESKVAYIIIVISILIAFGNVAFELIFRR